MPRGRRKPTPQDVRAQRPARPYLPDGTLDPQEWTIACSAAHAISTVVCAGEPWFVAAQPVHVLEQGVELEVVVRWLSSEVYGKVPAAVDGYVVNVVLEGATSEIHTLH